MRNDFDVQNTLDVGRQIGFMCSSNSKLGFTCKIARSLCTPLLL